MKHAPKLTKKTGATAASKKASMYKKNGYKAAKSGKSMKYKKKGQ